jgi:3',5'-cyclic AMP phosphodiesterase CpdA
MAMVRLVAAAGGLLAGILLLSTSADATPGRRRELREQLDELAAVHAVSAERVGGRHSGSLETGGGRTIHVRLRADRCYVFILVSSPELENARVVVRSDGVELGQAQAGPDDSAVAQVCSTERARADVLVTAAAGDGQYVFGQYELPLGTAITHGATPQATGSASPSAAGAMTSTPSPGGVWVLADSQIESYAGRAFGFQSPLADQVSSTAARPPAEVLGAEAIVRRVAWYMRDNPAPVVFLGDAGQVGCRQEVRSVFRWLDVTDQPWVFVPGNHDCFPMGSIAPDALAAIGEAALTTLEHPETWEGITSLSQFIEGALDPSNLGEQWAAACAEPNDSDAGVADKGWLVEQTADRFRAARSRAAADQRPYWREEHVVADTADGMAGDALGHWSSWIVQLFPIDGAEGGAPAAVGLALDTTDWSEPGEVVGISPGAQGCISSSQVDAAVNLVEQVRASVAGRELRVVVFGHHPSDHLYGSCALNLGRLFAAIGASEYVAAHTHRAAEPQPRRLLANLLPGGEVQITEHVIGSVVEYGGPNAEPEIERLRVGAEGAVSREPITLAGLAAQGSSSAPPLDCAPIWSSPATPAETLTYQDALLNLDAKHLWLVLSLDHLQHVGAWCANDGGPVRCQAPIGACSTVYEDAGATLHRLVDSPWFGVLDGSANATWQNVPDLLRCVRPALGLDEAEAEGVDPEVERYVFCTALRGAATEAGADVSVHPRNDEGDSWPSTTDLAPVGATAPE